MLYKIPLILVNALTFDRSMNPPHHARAPEQKRTGVEPKSILGLYERIVDHVGTWIRIGYWLLSASEIAVIIASQYPTSEISGPIITNLGPKGPSVSPLHSTENVTLTFLVGSVVLIAGARLRFRCFEVMGERFTFALSLRDSHKLCTSGPYSIIRHPGYTAGSMIIAGAFMTLLCSGSWWYCRGYLTSIGMALGLNWLLSGAFCIYAFSRGKKEDEFLKKEFGKQWDDWAEIVPYRYIPGVI